MDVCSSCGLSLSKDLKGLPDCNDPRFICKVTNDFDLNDLATFIEFLAIQDGQTQQAERIGSPGFKCICGIAKDDVSSEASTDKFSRMPSKMCLTNCTCPSFGNIASSARSIIVHEDGNDDSFVKLLAHNDHDKSANLPRQYSASLLTPLKPLSAMKGSREMRGEPPRGLTVTWAPDVYDPPPSALFHASTSNNYRHKSNGKRSLKNKHRVGDKSSRTSKGKDKKKTRKHSGNPYRYPLIDGGQRQTCWQ